MDRKKDIPKPEFKKTNFNVKLGLEYYFPSLLKLVEGDFAWRQLNKLTNKQFKKYAEKFEADGSLMNRINIFETSVYALQGKPNAQLWMRIFNHYILDLAGFLNAEEKKLIKNNIYEFVRYAEDCLNYFGELLVLHSLLRTGNYKLIKAEYGLVKGGVTIDFRMKNTTTNDFEHFEVCNIELDDTVFSGDYERFITGKLNDKLSLKSEVGFPYTLFPVIWIENHDNIKTLKNYYKQKGWSVQNVSIPHILTVFRVNNAVEQQVDFVSIVNAYK